MQGLMGLVKMALVIGVIVFVVIGGIRLFTAQPDVFLHGVYVNGISLGGYSLRGRVASWSAASAEERLNQNVITSFTYGDETWTLTPSMLNATMDVESQLALAWNFGHTGNFFQKKSQQDYLKDHDG